MLTPWIKNEVWFVHRRAWRFGSVDKHDLFRAFGMSVKTAQRRIHDALALKDPHGRPYVVRRAGSRGVFPNRAAERPPWATEQDLLGTLPMRADPDLFFCLSGIRESEIGLKRSAWVRNQPPTPGTLDELVRALVSAPKVVEARYVSFSPGDEGHIVRFVPMAIQQIGDQVAVYAYCLSKTVAEGKQEAVEAPRSYVLSRLSGARIINQRAGVLKKVQMRMPTAREPLLARRCRPNPRLTPEQVSTIRHELDMEGTDIVRRPASEMFQFLRMFSDLPARGVWPPLLVEEGPA